MTIGHVDSLIEEGQLGHVKVGRFIRLTVDDFDRQVAKAHMETERGVRMIPAEVQNLSEQGRSKATLAWGCS